MKEIRKEVDYRETPESKYVFMSRQNCKNNIDIFTCFQQ